MAAVPTAADRTIEERPTPGRRDGDRANDPDLRHAASRRRDRPRVCPDRSRVRRGRDRLRTTGHWIPSRRGADRQAGDRRDASRRGADRNGAQPSDRRPTRDPWATIPAGPVRTRRDHSGRGGRRPGERAGHARSVDRRATDPPRGSRTRDAGPWAHPANRGGLADPRRPPIRGRSADRGQLDAPGRVRIGAHHRLRTDRPAHPGSRPTWDAAG